MLGALLALTLLQHSRRDARLSADGSLVLLADQDRSLWRQDEIAEALDLLRALPQAVTPLSASYAVQAWIAAEHATAPSADQTRWDRIVRHYDSLVTIDPSPAARLARAVAVAEASGPASGLEALDGIDIPGSHRPASVRAELLVRLGRADDARSAYDEAIELCRNEAELAHLIDRRTSLTP